MRGYRLVKVIVDKAQYDTGVIELSVDGEDPNLNHVMTLHGIGGRGISFLSPYSSAKAVDKDSKIDSFFSSNSMNFNSGYFVMPKPGDKLLVAVFFHDLDSMTMQDPAINVIILGFIEDEFSFSNTYLHAITHQSGAGIKFNHAWLDPNTVEVGEKTINQMNGHVTLVGNRTVFLYGKKFLPFGGLSHQYTTYNDLVKQHESNAVASTSWSSIFTNDLSKTIYDPNFSQAQVVGTGNLFLDPPCPDENEIMHLHQSGWKKHVDSLGHELKVVGSNVTLHSSNYYQYSFDPRNALTSINSADQTYLTSTFTDGMSLDASMLGAGPAFTVEAQVKNRAFPGSEERILNGYYLNVTTSLPATVNDAINSFTTTEAGKYKLVIGNATVTIDGNTGDFQISNSTSTFSISGSTVTIGNGTVTMTMSGGTVNVA